MTHLVCPACRSRTDPSSWRFRCPCGEPYGVEHEPLPVDRRLFEGRAGSGVWRYRELVHPALRDDEIVTRHEGNTPLYDAPTVAAHAGLETIRLKHEGMNPTGSFKDRGMTVAVSQARRAGASLLACASTGNTAASLAAYAAAAGLRSAILVPEGAVALGKLGQSLAYGARTLLVRGDFDAAMRLVEEAGESLGVYLVNSINPFRLEGQKTIVLETLAQLGWDAPDWIAFPAGNLGNASAFGKALVEAREAGLVDRIPRLAAIQAEGANPFARAFRTGFGPLVPVRAETVATAIRIGAPVSYSRAVRAIRATNGVVTDVADDAILDAKAVVDAAGIGAEPASCASVAGVRRLVAEGVIGRSERVVCVLTGHLLKDPEATVAYHEGRLGDGARANRPRTVDPTIDDLRRALG